MAGSAQCTSSMTSSTGCRSASLSSSASSSSNSRARAVAGSAPDGGAPNSGSSPASSPAACPGSSAATSAVPRSRTSSRSAAPNGAYGKLAVLSSTHPPASTSERSRTRAANSPASLDLPTPASPPSSTVRGVPTAASWNAPANAASSPSRPANTGLIIAPTIPP